VLAQVVREASETDRGEKVDGEACVLGVVLGKEALKVLGHEGVAQALVELGEAEELGHLLEEDLDEDAARRGGLVLVEVNEAQHAPRQRVRVQQVRKDLGDVAQLVGLEAVDGRVLLAEALHEGVLVGAVEHAKSLRQQAVEAHVGALLRRTLEHHLAQLVLVRREVELAQLVSTLLKVEARHDGEVDGATECDEVDFGLVVKVDRWRSYTFNQSVSQ